MNIFPELIWFADSPMREAFQTNLLSKFARKKVKILLSGLGGDELFAGYPKYRKIYYAQHLPGFPLFVPKNFSPKLRKYLSFLKDSDPIKRYTLFTRALGQREKEEICSREFLKKNLKSPEQVISPFFEKIKKFSFFDQSLYVDAKTSLIDDLLKISDRQSMANSLELRVPLLDYKLVQLAFSIPQGIKTRNNDGKYIFKKALMNKIPSRVFQKKKQGFGNLKASTILSGEFKEVVKQTLSESKIFRPAYLKVLDKKYSPALQESYLRVLDMFTLEIWLRIYGQSNLHRPNLKLGSLI